MAPSPSAPGNSVLRLVLFGQPGAGKSSLLEALTRAAREQDEHGAVIDLGAGDELIPDLALTTVTTKQEVRPSLMTFRPHGGPEMNALLLDSAGQAAGRLLADGLALAASALPGSLADEVGHADALVLTVDVAVAPAKLEAELAAFAHFLSTLEEVRGDRVEVGGLPVFLVLTRCDLLARADDSLADWLERIEQRKRELDARFRAVLSQSQEGGFGHLELHLWATAARRPALGGKPAPKGESYGVTELFRLCLERAAAYQVARRRAARLLRWVVSGSAVVFVTLLGMIGAALVTGGQRDRVGSLTPEQRRKADLQRRVAALRATDKPTEAERLGRPADELEVRRDLLKETSKEIDEISKGISTDESFDKQLKEDQAFVKNRIGELDDYLDKRGKLLMTNPVDARSEKGLTDLAAELKEKVTVPQEWAGTEVAKLYEERLRTAKALEDAARSARDWFESNRREAAALLDFGDMSWSKFHERSGELLDPDPKGPGRKPQPRPLDPVPGAPSVTMQRVLNYPEVAVVADDSERTRHRLEQLRNIGIALNLSRRDRSRALLTFEDGFSLSDSAKRYKEIEETYKFLLSPKFSLSELGAGESARKLIAAEAQLQYDRLLEQARPAVFKRYQAFDPQNLTESRERWKFVADWLADNREANAQALTSWGDLAVVLVRLTDTGRTTRPTDDLIDFLKKDTFELQVNQLELEVPGRLNVEPAPLARLKVFYGYGLDTDLPLVWELSLEGEGVRDTRDRVMRYTFRQVKPDNHRIVYKPGDGMRAELELMKGQKFIWNQASTTSYQFERLLREPQMSGAAQADVRLKVIDPPKNGIPRVPDLLPDVLRK